MAPRVGEGVERMDVPCGIWGNCVEFVATLISFQAECSLLGLTWTRELPAPPLFFAHIGFLRGVSPLAGWLLRRGGTGAAAERH